MTLVHGQSYIPDLNLSSLDQALANIHQVSVMKRSSFSSIGTEEQFEQISFYLSDFTISLNWWKLKSTTSSVLKLLYLHFKVVFRDPNKWELRYHCLTMATMIQTCCTMHTERDDQPVWVLLCLCNSSLLVNRLPQKIQLHTNGLSPVCQRRCARRWDVLP